MYPIRFFFARSIGAQAVAILGSSCDGSSFGGQSQAPNCPRAVSEIIEGPELQSVHRRHGANRCLGKRTCWPELEPKWLRTNILYHLLRLCWNLQPVRAKHDFYFSEPTGTCSEPTAGVGQAAMPASRNLLEPCRNLLISEEASYGIISIYIIK